MSYQVTCTFDLKNATSQDYKTAYSDLSTIGLHRVVDGTNAKVVMPTTMTLGSFTGVSTVRVRDDIRERVRQAFLKRGFKSEIFIVVGENGTWGSAAT